MTSDEKVILNFCSRMDFFNLVSIEPWKKVK